jgi:hypothetical protein
MKVIRSVRDTRGNVIQKQPTGGAGRLRCPKCKGICTSQTMPNGKSVMRCPLGHSYVVQALSPARVPVPGAIKRR